MNAQVLAALERIQWSEIIDRKKQLGRCPACQRLESEGRHATDCYIGQALVSVRPSEPMTFLVSDDRSTIAGRRVASKAISEALVRSTLPPVQATTERQVFVEVRGRRIHVWDHDRDRSTRFSEGGRKLIEMIERMDFSALADQQKVRYYKWVGKQSCDYLCFSVDESSVIAYGYDLQIKPTPLTPGDIARCQAEGKMVEIEQLDELKMAA